LQAGLATEEILRVFFFSLVPPFLLFFLPIISPLLLLSSPSPSSPSPLLSLSPPFPFSLVFSALLPVSLSLS